ncbi:MAG: SpoIVB peptidase [Bacillota bacterium]
MYKNKKRILLLLSFLFISVLISSYFFIDYTLPHSFSVVKDYESTLSISFPLDLYFTKGEDCSTSLSINDREISGEPVRIQTDQPLNIKSRKAGRFSLDLRLFGLIPLRTLEVNVLPEIKVMPGGQAIGVLVKSDGVMVVRNSFVENKAGQKLTPARDAGLEPGDIIKKVNGKKIVDKSVLSEKIQENGKQGTLDLTVKKRDGGLEKISVDPVQAKQGKYQIGLYVDDSVSGVGTLTFFDENNESFGALGHVITEVNSKRKVDVLEGEIIETEISGINAGQRGVPGQKQGTFFETSDTLGTIEHNTNFGIYGKLKTEIDNPYFEQPIPVASISQIEEGPAKIYTVLRRGKIEEFSVELEQVFRQNSPETRGMVIKVTDPELKEATGGIVQGMSGSPIVQNDRLVGAVTHVFIDDPARGYGVFAEWMLFETEMVKQIKNQAAGY